MLPTSPQESSIKDNDGWEVRGLRAGIRAKAGQGLHSVAPALPLPPREAGADHRHPTPGPAPTAALLLPWCLLPQPPHKL